MHIKTKTLHILYAKKLKIVQIKKKAFGVSLRGPKERYCNKEIFYLFDPCLIYIRVLAIFGYLLIFPSYLQIGGLIWI